MEYYLVIKKNKILKYMDRAENNNSECDNPHPERKMLHALSQVIASFQYLDMNV